MAFAHIVHHIVQLPLGIYFFLASQCKLIPTVISMVTEYRFYGAQSFAVDTSAFGGIDLGFHAAERGVCDDGDIANSKANLFDLCFFWVL